MEQFALQVQCSEMVRYGRLAGQELQTKDVSLTRLGCWQIEPRYSMLPSTMKVQMAKERLPYALETRLRAKVNR
jgi:hypothetical protein